MKKIELNILENNLSVCRLPPNSNIPSVSGSFFSLTKTNDELSLIVEEGEEPVDAKIEKGWRALKVIGPLDFSLTGIMSSLTAP